MTLEVICTTNLKLTEYEKETIENACHYIKLLHCYLDKYHTREMIFKRDDGEKVVINFDNLEETELILETLQKPATIDIIF